MARRRFNWKLAVVILIALAVLAVTAFALRKWQRTRMGYAARKSGLQAYQNQDWDQAAKQLGQYISTEPDDVEIILKYAEAQINRRPLRRGNVQQALQAYRTILRADKHNQQAAQNLVTLFIQMNAPAEASLVAERYLQDNEDVEVARMYAVALARQHKYAQAIRQLKNIIEQHPEDIPAYDVLGRLMEQYPDEPGESAADLFEQAVQENPSSALACIIRAGFYRRTGRTDKALADLDRAENLDLSETAVRLPLAGEYILLDQLDKARLHLQQLQQDEPNDPALWQNWARLALKAGSAEEMRSVADSGLKQLASLRWDFIPTAAELYIRCGELDKATACITELQEKDMVPGTTAFLEGFVAEQKGRNYQAVRCYRHALELGNTSARVRLALASLLSRLGDIPSALRQFETLVSEYPDSFRAQLAYAELLARVGDYAGTAEHADRARHLSPQSLQAALAYFEARIRLLTEGPDTSRTAGLLQDMKKQLASLDEAAGGNPAVKFLRFQLTLYLKDFASAEDLVAQMEKQQPSDLDVALAQTQLLAAQQKHEQAIAKLREIIKEFPNKPDPVRYLAFLLAQQDRINDCETVIKDAMKRSDEPEVQQELGLLLAAFYNQWNQQEKACEVLQPLAERFTQNVTLKRRLLACPQVAENTEKAQNIIDSIKSLEGEQGWRWRYEQARLYSRAEDFEDMYPRIISLLKENLHTNPDDQASRMLLAESHRRSGNLQMAVSAYREALDRSPRDLRIIIPTVAALYEAREYQQADEILNRAARQNLYHPQLQRLQLQSYLRHGQLESATELMYDIHEYDPNDRAVSLSLALLMTERERFDQARELLVKLRKAEPNSLSVIAAQVQLEVRQDHNDNAIKLCDETIRRLNSPAAYSLRARTYTVLGRNEKAAGDFEHATAMDPNNINLWKSKIDFYHSTGRIDKAAAAAEHALSLEPDNVDIQQRAAAVFFASADPDRVRRGKEILDRALQANPDKLQLRMLKARSLLAERTRAATDEAIEILRDITSKNPRTADAWDLLGQVALRRGRTAEAIDIALRGLAHNSNNRTLLLLKAQAEAQGSADLAIPTLKGLWELDPNDIEVTLRLARAYSAADQPAKAVDLLENCLKNSELTPKQRDRFNIALAGAFYQSGNTSQAEQMFNSLTDSSTTGIPDNAFLAYAMLLKADRRYDKLRSVITEHCQKHTGQADVMIALAKSLSIGGEQETVSMAENILRDIINEEPNNTAAMEALAIMLQGLGRYEQSTKLYRRIINLDPGAVVAMNNLAWLLCEEQGMYDQALELAQQGLQKAPNYADLIDTCGVIHYRLNEHQKATEEFKRCLELYPPNAPACVASRFHLVRVLVALKQTNQALENLREALDLNNRIGGLSAADLTEARRLYGELSQEYDDATIPR